MKVVNLLKENSKDSLYQQFKSSINNGLSLEQKKISSEFFYDDIGSKLFQKITLQPEYYLTKTEYSILESNAEKIIPHLKLKKIDLIELGAGDGHKTKLIIDCLKKHNIEINFYPIDISIEAMNLLQEHIQEDSKLSITGVVAKYFEGIRYIQEHSQNQKIILFLGSNIGNTDQNKGLDFLRLLSPYLKPEDLFLCGFDLVKENAILNSAYNDRAGVTREFNLNLLSRINKELGANFNLNQFNHMGRFNPKINAMESFLVSKIDQNVYIESLDKKFFFNEFEPIHLEYSFKFSQEEIEGLALNTSFKILENFSDTKHFFIDSLWQKQ